MSGTNARLGHLSSDQRNHIYTTLISQPHNTMTTWRRTTQRLARQYGVTQVMIKAVYVHVWAARRNKVIAEASRAYDRELDR